jgi:hypothetical protein
MFVPYCFKIGRECPFEIEEEDDFAFVLMPFAPEFTEIYQQGIKKAWEELGFRCLRSDEDIHTHDIMCRAICQNIQRARFIVADMTGRNPNVFYELGLAHAFGKPVILVTQRAKDVPFDLKAILYIDYGGDINKLNQELTKMAEGLLAGKVASSPPRRRQKGIPLERKPEELLPLTLSYEEMYISQDIHKYRLVAKFTNTLPEAQEGFRFEVFLPARVPKESNGFHFEKDVRIDHELYSAAVYESSRRVFPGQPVEICGRETEVYLEYQMTHSLYWDLSSRPVQVLWRIYFPKAPVVEGKVPFKDLHCF